MTIAGIDQLRARFNANAWSGRIEGGYRFVVPVMGGLGVTPYAAGQFTTFELPGYPEAVITGTNAFALNYGAQERNGHAQRTRFPHRQIVRHGQCNPDAARPGRMGA